MKPQLGCQYLYSVLNSVSLAPSWVSWVSCHHAIVPSWARNFLEGISWAQNFFSLIFVGPQFFLWVFHESNIFLWVFHRSNIFLVGISWVQHIFSQVSRGSKILWLSINFGKKIKRNVLLTNFN